MQVDSPEHIRNVAVTGHSGTGKTTLTSAMLYTTGTVNRLNRTEDGNTVTDFDAEETERGISIGLAVCAGHWRQNKLNFLDTPGYGIFFAETQAGLQAADATLLTIDGVAGVEVLSERVWATTQAMNLPVLIALTKMDRERASLGKIVDNLRQRFGREVVPIQVPIGAEHDFHGVVDLVTGQAWKCTFVTGEDWGWVRATERMIGSEIPRREVERLTEVESSRSATSERSSAPRGRNTGTRGRARSQRGRGRGGRARTAS
jgi:elongation factor G